MDVIYVQFLPECEKAPGDGVTLGDMAHIEPADQELAALAFEVPERGRRVDGAEVACRIAQARPGARIELLGTGEIFVSRRNSLRGPLGWALKAVMALLLFFGAALAITFFHEDVNMTQAQLALCAMLGGGTPEPLELAVPYAAGVLAGVGGFFLLGGRKKSPLALKLQAYRKQLEQAEESGGNGGGQA